MGRPSSDWTVLKTAVLRPEKLKSRPSTLGRGKQYLVRSPVRAAWAIAGPPG